MNRAERRRQQKEETKKQKTFIMTAEQVDMIRKQEFEKASEEFKERYKTLARDTFLMMLSIPTNVLIADYWPKSAEKRIPEFVDKCMDLYEAWSGHDVVKMQQMVEMTEIYGKCQLVKKDSSIGRAVNDKKFTD